jgi:hypothetical protein
MSKKAAVRTGIKILAGLILAAAVFLGAWYGIQNAGKELLQNGLETTEDNIRRGAVACYALEGRYPDSLDYLMKNYGVKVDEDKYNVYYTVFASNIMPDITVAVK